MASMSEGPPADAATLMWINGPFGGGKTITACELHRRLPGSVICDPEHVGFGMRRMLPEQLRGNFQDLPTWRRSVTELLAMTLASCRGAVIVPMTITDPGYLGEIIGALREDGHDVRHFALLADPSTVRRRLRKRSLGLWFTREDWALARLEPDLHALAGEKFAVHIKTDHLTVAQVAETIASAADLPISAATDGPLRAAVRQYATTIRHIRFD
jgi:hypothetical protein